jgi:hypothetical protein
MHGLQTRRLLIVAAALAAAFAPGAVASGPDSPWGPPQSLPPPQGAGCVRFVPGANSIACEVDGGPSPFVVLYDIHNVSGCPLPPGTISITMCAPHVGQATDCVLLRQIAIGPSDAFPAGTRQSFTNSNPYKGLQETCTALEAP